MDWVDLAQKKGKWRALLNTEVNLRVPYNPVTFLTSSGVISFQRRLCFMDLVTAVRQISQRHQLVYITVNFLIFCINY
jgi:hypothetical protein